MTNRDRLIELLKVCLNYENIETDDGYVGFDVRYENIADYLLANGVIFPQVDAIMFFTDKWLMLNIESPQLGEAINAIVKLMIANSGGGK